MQLDKILREDERVRLETNIKQEKKLQFIGSKRKIPGLKLFSYNVNTGELALAETDNELSLSSETLLPQEKRRVIINSDCIYVQALNEKNAWKHLLKLIEK